MRLWWMTYTASPGLPRVRSWRPTIASDVTIRIAERDPAGSNGDAGSHRPPRFPQFGFAAEDPESFVYESFDVGLRFGEGHLLELGRGEHVLPPCGQ